MRAHFFLLLPTLAQLCTGLLIPLSTCAHAALSLPQALELALQKSPVYDAAAQLKEVRELEYRSAIARFLPSADVSATHGLQNSLLGPSYPNAPWASSLTLGLTENLYDNGISIIRVGIARLNLRLAEIEQERVRDALTLDLSSEFYRYSLLTLLLQTRKDQQALIEKQFRSLENQYHQGYKTRSDYLRIRAQAQRAEIDRISAENDLAVSQAELARIMGLLPGADRAELPVLTPLPVTTVPTLAAQPPVFEATFEARTAVLQKEVNDRNVKFAVRNYWPQVTVSSAITYGNGGYLGSAAPLTANQTLNWNALLGVQFNLWDWGIRRRDVAVAERNADIQNDTVQGTLLQTRKDLTALMAELTRVQRSLALSRELLSLEEETYRDLEARYREGKVPYLDLVTSLGTRLQARIQYYTSYFELLRSAVRYHYYEGKAYESISRP